MTPPALQATSPAKLGRKMTLTPDATYLLVAAQKTVEIGDGLGQPLVERHLRFPLELVARQRDIRAALHRIVDRQRLEDQLRLAADRCDDLLGEMLHRQLDRIAEIDRAGEIVRRMVHQAQPTLD